MGQESSPYSFRTALGGWLIAATALVYLLSLMTGRGGIVSAILAWTAVYVCWPGMARSAQGQALTLLLSGLALICWAALAGTSAPWQSALTRNLPLLTMFVAVSFLSLTNPTDTETGLQRGRKGILTTMLTCHLLGSVINLSIVFVVADRLSRATRLTEAQVQTIMRSFCAAAFWSPFFVAIGVALTYAPGARWLKSMAPGLLLTLPVFAITYRDAVRNAKDDFHGYPLSRESLIMPICLAVAVLIGHGLAPQLSILTLISLLAPLGAWLFMKEPPRLHKTQVFIQQRLANIASQFALFLTAGIFSAGIAALIASYPDYLTLHFTRFSPLLFMALSAAMIFVALLGVHPLVSIALLSPFLTPLGADPNQLAFMFLFVWGVSTASSPLSGVGLAMVGRYQVRSRDIVRLNWHYLVMMWGLAGLINAVWFG